MGDIDAYFEAKDVHEVNDMTNSYEGYNVITILGETLETRFINETLTPNLYMMRENGLSFDNFFKLEREFISFCLLRILVAGLFILMYLPVIPLFIELIESVSVMVDPNAIERYLQTSDIVPRLAEATKITSILLISFWLISIKFHLVPYIIIDQKVNLFEALKISWKITKGNYLKILIFPY